MSILQRSIKVILATGLSVLLAQALKLPYATTAGIIAILSVLDSRRSTVRVVRSRFFAYLLALLVASLIFSLVGFSIGGIFLFLIFYLPLTYQWNLAIGIAPSVVSAFHLYQEGQVTLSLLGTECLLYVIGAGLALLVNSYMPSKDKQIEAYQYQVEDKLREIMLKFETLLVAGDGSNQAKLINELDDLLEKALITVYLEKDNQVFQRTNYHVHYFEMRQAQNNILRNMARLMNQLDRQSPESVLLAQLFAETAEELSETNSGQELLDGIGDFLSTFRKRELPKTRAEFENRALLFQLLNDMQHFLQLKLDFYHHHYMDEAE